MGQPSEILVELGIVVPGARLGRCELVGVAAAWLRTCVWGVRNLNLSVVRIVRKRWLLLKWLVLERWLLERLLLARLLLKWLLLEWLLLERPLLERLLQHLLRRLLRGLGPRLIVVLLDIQGRRRCSLGRLDGRENARLRHGRQGVT
jgi:hypothetical protein